MAATFNTGTQVAPGNNYTPNNVTNPVLVWIAYARRPGPTTLAASNWLFGATSMNEAPNTDVFNDIAGGGDPVAACATLANPSISSQALSVTWSNSTTAEFGYAITITGGNQTTPVSDSDGSAYGSDASPSLSYTAPDNSVVIYWRIHAQSSSTVWTDPTGFTRDFSTDFVTSPSFRTFAVWYKEVSTGETTSVSATADNAGDGGVHGFIVVDEEAAASTLLPVQPTRVLNTGTTATGIIGLN